MFNDYLANEEAKQHIQRRIEEAETYRLHRRLRHGKQIMMARSIIIALLAFVVATLCGWL
jgi:hypothetical protein